jgi:hypothetical protein
MPKKKTTTMRAASRRKPRPNAIKMLRASAADHLSLKVSPSTRRKVRRSLPIAAAVAAGGAMLATGILLREHVIGAVRATGSAGATAAKSVASALAMDRLLEGAGLSRKPLWIRALPALGVVGGLLAAGAAAFFLIPRGEAHDAMNKVLGTRIDADEFAAGPRSIPLSNSVPSGGASSHERG